jgi:catechol 2,3-dioxygenase-like lactoylglutathione lyase family enzyme
MMLAYASMTTILPVMNMQRARDFYENKLGLKPEGAKPNGEFVYTCGDGARLALYPKENGTKADHTAISFQVPAIEVAIKELEKSGVVFEDYDLPGLKTVNHVCVLGSEKAAWFKDTEGNYLCIHEDMA